MSDKVKEAIDLSRQGFRKDQIAEHLGYKRVDSLDRYMKQKGYKYINNCYTVNSANFTKLPKTNYRFSFKTLDLLITDDISKEYERLANNYTDEKLRILSLMLLKKTSESGNVKSNKLIRNVKTFFEAAFKNNFSRLTLFLQSENIPFDIDAIKKFNSIRAFLKEDILFNEYLKNVSISELESLRNKLSLINPFTENLKKALK